MSLELRAGWDVEEAIRAYSEAADEALLLLGEVYGEEADRTAPIEEGTLVRSRRVAQTGDGEVSVGYGGAASAYARYQHERTDLRHDPGRRAKWLQLTWVEQAPRFVATLGQLMRGRLR
jgi:hypothetical protein